MFFIAALAAFAPAQALAHDHGGVRIGLGIGCCGFFPGYYDGYYPNTYYAPPPVVYTVPPPPQIVYMEAPPQVIYAAPPQQPSGAVVDSNSPTYTDSYGRTCRQYQSGSNKGMACLQPDGSWRIVP
jgi:hypothetical protein